MTLATIIVFAAAVLAVLLAVAALADAPRQRVNWLFATGLLLLSIEALFIGLLLTDVTPSGMAKWIQARHQLMAIVAPVWLTFSAVYSRAEQNAILRRWRWYWITSTLALGLLSILASKAILVELSLGDTLRTTDFRLGWCGIVFHGVLVVCSVLILMNLEQVFRASVGTMRWRVKFMVLALGLLFGVRLYTSTQAMLYRGQPLSLLVVDASALIVACLLMAVALKRSRLFEIEIYPSQAVLHNSVTAILAGIYLLVVGVLARLATSVGGDAAFPVKAFLILVGIVGVGLLVFSDRVRQTIRLQISRHFQRPIYDYRKVWLAFTERTSSILDTHEFCRAVARLISETFGTLSVTVWLVDESRQKLVFAASTLLGGEQARDIVSGQRGSLEPVLEGLRRHPGPIDLDADRAPWLADLQACNPDFFGKGGNRICVPLISGGEVLGLIMLADRVSGLRFSTGDLDLLKCIGDQVAAGLRNLQLSKAIVKTRETEAFQAMSTFFVHDLKNMAYSLSLMLQNMTDHFGDPAFRETALKGLGRSVSHLNDLISRFSLLRQALDIKPVPCDLNETIKTALAAIGPLPDVRIQCEFGPVPPVRLDPAQFQKVITNLVLNAREALEAGGEIRIQTSRAEAWICLSVSDNGVGMSREFIEHSLFRPFKSTKKNGFGIGMYHSKLIIEAHQGRIDVESEPGRGTTFRILLPANPERT